MDANNDHSPIIPAGQELPAASPPREPAANALRHGLSGQKYLPPALHPGRIEEIYARLHRELSPRTFLDELALREVARHAALLEIVEQGEPAVLRLAAQQVAGLFVVDGETDDDVAIAAAVTAEPLDRVARYRRGHEKALNAAIDKLAALRTPQTADAPLAQTKRVDPFATITACEDFVRQTLRVRRVALSTLQQAERRLVRPAAGLGVRRLQEAGRSPGGHDFFAFAHPAPRMVSRNPCCRRQHAGRGR